MWYQNYGWKSSPFLIKPSPDIINFDLEKEKLTNYILSGDICFLVGEPGIGKTSLLKWLELNIKNNFMVYLNAEELDNSFSIKKFLKDHTKFTRKLFGHEYPKNSVFLLDESHHSNENLRRALKLHYDENNIKSIVFSQPGKDAEIPEGFRNRVGNRVVKLNKLSEEKSFELIKRRCGKFCPFSEGAINLIIEKSEYIPRKILENCETICLAIKDKKEININDVQSVLKIRREEKPKNSLLSPMEENILNILKDSTKTAQELAEILKSTEGSVGKQLSKLVHKKMVNIVSNKRPKVYSLIPNSS